MSEPPSTPPHQTQPRDYNPRTPPPAPLRGSSMRAQLQGPGYAYRMSGNQVPSPSTNFNTTRGLQMSTLRRPNSDDWSTSVPASPTPKRDANSYNGFMAALDSAGFGDSQLSPMPSRPATNSGDARSSTFAATAHNCTDFGAHWPSMQLGRTPTRTVGDGAHMSMTLTSRRHNPPTPAHLRNIGSANRLTLMPPVPPTPTKPNVGSGTPKTRFNQMQLNRSARVSTPSVAGVVNSRVAKSTNFSLQQKKKRTIGTMGDLSISMKDGARKQPAKGSYFRFLDLPGELRNQIYAWATCDTQQALVVRRPRMASLRSRTRLDRFRAMPNYDPDDEDKPTGKKAPLERKTNRPCFAFTQVCRQLRSEFFPIYVEKQEIGLDLTDVVPYLMTVYNKDTLSDPQKKLKDKPFKGNITVALSWQVGPKEKDGVQIIELLILWANSFKMEAGFGRYTSRGYNPHTDGEAKDMYRLFGRVVLPNRSCGPMNQTWRKYLRQKHIASVTVHRAPPPRVLRPLQPSAFHSVPGVPVPTPTGPSLTVSQRPYFHILFKPQFAEPWMRSVNTPIPSGWLAARGFANMEFFEIRVGRWSEGHYLENSLLI